MNLLDWSAGNEERKRDIWVACKRDILFYINSFVYTYDPRLIEDGQDPVVPFVTYPFQDHALNRFTEALGKRDEIVKKSRDMGATWLILMVFEWAWHFYSMRSFMLVSRKESLVDGQIKDEGGDPDSLFAKIDFIHKRLPPWLMPLKSRSKLHLANLELGGTIDGESSTGDAGRGGRRTAHLLDEFASQEDGHNVLSATRDNSRCRFINSTPKGTGNAFYRVVTKKGDGVICFWWPQHPEKRKGLYQWQKGELVQLDYENPPPNDYLFIKDGKVRSPWYDEQCRRASHSAEIAQELDIDFHGSDFQFFSNELLLRCRRETMRPPYRTGRINFDEDKLEPTEKDPFVEVKKGHWKFWIYLDVTGKPPRDRNYVVGIDVGTGSEATNSVICVADRKTGEKVAEYANNAINPAELAKMAVVIGRFFRGVSTADGALIIFEANGPGIQFATAILSLRYPALFWRKMKESAAFSRTTKNPGWWSTTETKRQLLGDYHRAMAEGTYVERSEKTLDECEEYVYKKTGDVVHGPSQGNVDTSATKENHGDRVIASALCVRGLKDVGVGSKIPIRNVGENSFMARKLEQMSEKRKREASY